jgi:hypothetical protein
VLTPVNGGVFRYRDVNSGGKSQTSLQANLTALPLIWSPGTTYMHSPMSAYLEQASGQ